MSDPCLLIEAARMSRCGYSSTPFLEGTELSKIAFAGPCQWYSPVGTTTVTARPRSRSAVAPSGRLRLFSFFL